MARWFTADPTDPTGRRGFLHLTGEDVEKYQKDIEYQDRVMFDTFVLRSWEGAFWSWVINTL